MKENRSKLVSFPAAQELFPTYRCLMTLHNYRKRGVPVGDGRIAKLRCTKVGRGYFTCQEWIDEFIAEMNGGHLDIPPAQQEERHQAVETELDRLGC